MKNKHYCSVYSCLNNDKDNSDLGFFSLPSDRDRYIIWLKNIGRDEIINKGSKINTYRVCEIHFDKRLISISTNGKNKRKYLKKYAIPTLNLPNLTKTYIKPVENTSTANESTENISTEFIPVPENVGDIFLNEQKPVFTEDPVEVSSDSMEMDIEEPKVFEQQPDLSTLNNLNQNNTITTEKVIQLHIAQTQLIEIVPTRDETKNVISQHVQTPAALFKNIPQERKLRQELYEVKKELKKLRSYHAEFVTDPQTKVTARDKFFRMCDKFLNKNLADLVRVQSQLRDNNPGNRYNKDFKYFCLNLYYNNPASYERLQDTFCLPSRGTLRRVKIPLTSEINEDVARTLKAKMDLMSVKQKYCTVVIGTINVKTYVYYDLYYDKLEGLNEIDGEQTAEPATHTIFVMARGILDDWKQPITYALLGKNKNNEDVKRWINKILVKLFDIGFDVRALVTDLDSDYLKDQVTAEKPFFYVNNKKIYYIFDTPHLHRIVRDNFMLYDFNFEGLVAKWEHVLQYYDIDKRKPLRLTPKLTDIHMKPINMEKIKVEIAAQVLSQSVAAAISTYVDCNVLDMSAMGTVKFIALMNNIFDVLNSDTLKAKYEYKMAFSGEPSQIKFMYDMITFFNGLRLTNRSGYDITENVKFIEAFKITILSVLSLHEDLKTEKHPHLLTRRLNLDCIEDILVRIREQNLLQFRTEIPPTCKQLVSFLKREYIVNIKVPDEGNNNTNDLDNFLNQARYLGNLRKDTNTTDTTDSGQEVDSNFSRTLVRITDYLDMELPEKDKLCFVAKYLLKKGLEHHKDCSKMDNYVPKDNNTSPPVGFLQFVERMDEKLLSYFCCEELKGELCSEILKLIDSISFDDSPCKEFPLRFIKILFIRIRINYIIKENNKLFKRFRNRGKHRFIVNSFT